MENILVGIKSYESTQWDSILSSIKHSSFYHTSRWLDSVDSLDTFTNVSKIFEFSQDNVLFPLFKAKKGPLSYYSSVPAGYGGILSQHSLSEEMIRTIINHFLKRLTVKIKIRLSPFDTTSYTALHNETGHFTLILKLDTSYEEIWKKKYSKKCRNVIRKAQKKHLTVFEENNTEEAIDIYMKLYDKCHKRWQNKNPLEREFLLALLKENKNRETRVFFVYYEGTPISGMINFYHNREVITWGQVSDSSYWKYSPNNFLYDWSIKDAIEKDYLYYNFGASNSTDLTRFKKAFGPEMVETKVYVKENFLGKFAKKFQLVS